MRDAVAGIENNVLRANNLFRDLFLRVRQQYTRKHGDDQRRHAEGGDHIVSIDHRMIVDGVCSVDSRQLEIFSGDSQQILARHTFAEHADQ